MHSDWVNVPRDLKFWNPENKGFNENTAEFRCDDCGHIEPFSSKCQFCGSVSRVLATGRGLPGIFCTACKEGSISWKCPKCGVARQIHLSLFYDPKVHTLLKSSRCFVATVCAGIHSWEVMVLSNFRDDFLIHSPVGKRFIQLYEEVGPRLAQTLYERPRLARAIRRLLIKPLATLIAITFFKS